MTGFVVTGDVVAAVLRHMNGDHADDCRVICQGLGGVRDATAAEMTGMDAEAMFFTAAVHGSPTPVRVPFSAPLTERRQIRAEAARMYSESCAVLGVTPRPGAG